MSALRPMSRSRSLQLGAVGTGLAGLVVAGLPVSPATSAVPPDACPSAVPVTEVANGMTVDGLTVTSGSTPEAFTGEVLGVLGDGIAPGLDMIMVRLEGAQITDAGGAVDRGVWAGMSGSPVYAEDGRLLGAVAYGLSFAPSDVAGVTPAAAMLELSQDPGSTAAKRAAAGARRVEIPARVGASSGLTRAQASGGFRRLPMPFSVSGLSGARLAKVVDRFDIRRRLVTGSAAAAEAAPPAIVPGGNLVASLSYGDITYAGTGTATAVCGGEVLGFGHPLLWAGRSTYSMHNAEAIYIQRDNVFGSFKVANPTAPLGGIFQDRLAGIVGVNDEFPDVTDVTSHVTSTIGGSRDGQTSITTRGAIPFLSAIHLVANADRVLDKVGAGSAEVSVTVAGTRADASAWQYTRSNSFASGRDIAYESAFEPYRHLSAILGNQFERVNITDVDYEATYAPAYRALSLTGLEARVKGAWVTVGNRRSVPVLAGSELALRATLT
ncbi:MAG: hypothetical protein M3Q17_11800, partial [Actinomycetota bacterium]|nr:hypothetical protein [Actinomycetota bacterium]